MESGDDLTQSGRMALEGAGNRSKSLDASTSKSKEGSSIRQINNDIRESDNDSVMNANKFPDKPEYGMKTSAQNKSEVSY